MIHIELSVEPHYKEVQWSKKDPLKPAAGSEPPHVIRKWEFEKWHQVSQWHDQLQLVTDSDCLADVIKDGMENNEYVQHELDLLDVTGQVYTKAGLSIEGKEE